MGLPLNRTVYRYSKGFAIVIARGDCVSSVEEAAGEK